MNKPDLWNRYQQYLCHAKSIGLTLDVSRMNFEDSLFQTMNEPISRALEAMGKLEQGGIANPDENRTVGHYWLRAPDLAPQEQISTEIKQTIASIKTFAAELHEGAIKPQKGDEFFVVLVIGIGGSALGPQLICDALGTNHDPMIVRFLDNSDPDGVLRVLAELDETLAQALTVVISKSGGTKETRNTMMEVAHAYQQAGLDFARHAVAITAAGSLLDKKAIKEKWLKTFPIWDFVGGRTSITSAVGLLPAALLGVDVDQFLEGARDCDAVTRTTDIPTNPAAMLALMWFYAGNGCGNRSMVVMPYRDRLALLGRYLQQLIMESLGKEKDRDGQTVHQGLTVWGNKGSTDQHAYVQQLMEGPNDFFVQFIHVRGGLDESGVCVEKNLTSGDYLHAFFLGTREALEHKGRESITLVLDDLDARSLGALIALFERTVGLYAELINVNAYHQPAVEAGKNAAANVLDIQLQVLAHLHNHKGQSFSAETVATAIKKIDEVETVQHVLANLAASQQHQVKLVETDSLTPLTYQLN